MALRRICDCLCTPECTPNELNLIKEKFRSQIKSERLMDKIVSLRILLKVLERRDIISNENKQQINIIAAILNRRIESFREDPRNNNIPLQNVNGRLEIVEGNIENNYGHRFEDVNIPRQNFRNNGINTQGKQPLFGELN